MAKPIADETPEERRRGYADYRRKQFMLWTRVGWGAFVLCVPSALYFLGNPQDSWRGIISGTIACTSGFVWIVAAIYVNEARSALWELIDSLLGQLSETERKVR